MYKGNPEGKIDFVRVTGGSSYQGVELAGGSS